MQCFYARDLGRLHSLPVKRGCILSVIHSIGLAIVAFGSLLADAQAENKGAEGAHIYSETISGLRSRPEFSKFDLQKKRTGKNFALLRVNKEYKIVFSSNPKDGYQTAFSINDLSEFTGVKRYLSFDSEGVVIRDDYKAYRQKTKKDLEPIDFTEDSYSGGRWINNSGDVAGYSNPRGVQLPCIGTRAAVWLADGTKATWLGFTGGISERGDVSGSMITDTTSCRVAAVIWTKANGLKLLPQTDGEIFSVATAIDPSGQTVVGIRQYQGETAYRATIWSGDSQPVDIDTFGLDVSIYAINSQKVVVGSAMTDYSQGVFEPFIWSADSGMQILPLFANRGFIGEANGINEKGTVVGVFLPPIDGGWGDSHPFVWTKEAGFSELDTGGLPGAAIGINESGDIVGVLEPSPSTYLSVVWRLRSAKSDCTSKANDFSRDDKTLRGKAREYEGSCAEKTAESD
jgi:uncharacterized membrane protein